VRIIVEIDHLHTWYPRYYKLLVTMTLGLNRHNRSKSLLKLTIPLVFIAESTMLIICIRDCVIILCRVMWHHITEYQWQFTSTHRFTCIRLMRYGNCCHGIAASSHLLLILCTVPPSLVCLCITISKCSVSFYNHFYRCLFKSLSSAVITKVRRLAVLVVQRLTVSWCICRKE